MTSESLKLYKLIILYFLSQTRQPISNAILSDFILKNNYADYFSIQETLSALTDDRMIFLEKTYSKAFYTIAPKGLETLDFFGHLLPDDTKFQIDQYLVENKITIVEDTTIHTDFKQLGPKQYLAKGSVIERGNIIFEVAINVTSEDEALQVCQRFKEKNDLLFAYVYKALSSDE